MNPDARADVIRAASEWAAADREYDETDFITCPLETMSALLDRVALAETALREAVGALDE